MKRLFALLLLAGCTEAAAPPPGQAPVTRGGLDTAAFPYSPQQTPLEGCDLSLGVDPSWSLDSSSRTDEKGDQSWTHTATFRSAAGYGALEEAALPLQGRVTVTCLETTLTADRTGDFLGRYTGSDRATFSPAELSAPGTWLQSVGAITEDGPGGAPFRYTVVNYASVAEGMARLLRLRLPERRTSGVVEVLPTGATASLPGDFGTTTGVIGRETQVGTDDRLSGVRTRDENLAFAQQVAATLR